MLPDDQRQGFISAYADAEVLARSGRVAVGYVVLDYGLERAEQARREGAFWAEEVVGLYREALKTFVQRYGHPDPWPARQEDSLEGLSGLALVGMLIERQAAAG